MKVSIVVPTYNQGQYILDCLASIQNQTYKEIEVIIQDSLSDDQTQKICEEFVKADLRFQYFREKDSGQSDAINRGLVRSSGVFWTWICSDDYFADERAISQLVAKLTSSSQNGNVIGAYGDAQYVSETGKFVGPYYNATRDLGQIDFKLSWPLAQPSLLVFRKIVADVGGVDKNLYLGMDLDLFLNILAGDRIFTYVPQLIASIRLQPNSKSVKLRADTALNALTIIKKHFGDLGDPRVSAYTKEYNEARSLAAKQFVQNIVWAIIPLSRKVSKSIVNAKRLSEEYIAKKESSAFLVGLIRIFWGFFGTLKHYAYYPFRSIAGSMLKRRMRRRAMLSQN